MNQYERIVSYLYRYEGGEKKENSGYAKVERREAECRIQIQTKVVKPMPQAKAYLYTQEETGVVAVEIGDMQMGRNEMRLKARTEIHNLFGSGKTFEQMDGIFIGAGQTIFFATTWKRDYFNPGAWKQQIEQQSVSVKTERNKKEQPAPAKAEENTGQQSVSVKTEESTRQQSVPVKAEQSIEQQSIPAKTEQSAEQQSTLIKTEKHTVQEQILSETEQKMDPEPEKPSHDSGIEVQSMCGECPLKQKTAGEDYGQRILMTFPTMYPFKEIEKGSCVKMDLQDIGCLPMRFWSLSGNRFLLHGYYCYRHLLFLRDRDGGYSLGVPGIYNEKECRNGARYGFRSFRPISGEKRQGAFGYWLLKLE